MRPTSKLVIGMSILAIGARLILVDQPFVDHWSWRQSDVAAIARNYFQGGYSFANPQIDWAGDQPGFVGTEFPILPFLVAALYKCFGSHEWIGRIQAVILFALSLPFFFLLVRKAFGEIAAVWALFFYSFAPLGVMASRCFIPDTPSLALSIIGLYFFERWISDQRSTIAFIVSALCISLSILIKATTVLIAAPLACLAFQHFKLSAFRNLRFSFRDLVLARLRDLAAILSASLFWRGRSENHAGKLVLEHCSANSDFRVNAAAFSARNLRRVANEVDGTREAVSLVARSDGAFYRGRWLRKSTPVVSTSARANLRRFCGHGLLAACRKDFKSCFQNLFGGCIDRRRSRSGVRLWVQVLRAHRCADARRRFDFETHRAVEGARDRG
ncbi:MAG: hypothetical protein DME57_06650 [Verrucomicrobia bacterium]|nr:MAG: hypothetical protein DME57_06650 [Verrucomicrobiota bacterium]